MDPEHERLTVDERRKFLKQMAARYRVADRAGRGVLLTEMVTVTEMHASHHPKCYRGQYSSPERLLGNILI